jgi:hypothetical protein
MYKESMNIYIQKLKKRKSQAHYFKIAYLLTLSYFQILSSNGSFLSTLSFHLFNNMEKLYNMILSLQ